MSPAEGKAQPTPDMPDTPKEYDSATRLFASDQLLFVPATDGNNLIVHDPQSLLCSRVNSISREILEAFQPGRTAGEMFAHLEREHQRDLTEEERIAIQKFVERLFAEGYLSASPIEGPPKRNLWNGKPGAVYVHLTFDCTLRCVYCYNMQARDGFPGNPSPLLQAQEWKDLIDQSADLGVKRIIFTGGEPLLADAIFDIARHCRKRHLETELLTNGTLITEENVSLVVDLFDTVDVSLDSVTADVNDLTRGPGSCARIMRGIRRLIDANHPHIVIAPTITGSNFSHLPELVSFVQESSQLRLKPIEYCPYLSDVNPTCSDLELSTEQMDAVADLLPDLGSKEASGSMKFELRDCCGMLCGEFSVDPIGDVYPCQSLHYDHLCLGNVRETGVEKLFYSEKATHLRNLTHVDTIPVCRDCGYRYVCGGGCRAIANARSGRLDGHNAIDCERFRILSNTRLEVLAKGHQTESGQE